MKPLVLVYAVSRNGVIGKGGGLPWKVPEDLKHFRRVTTGHAIIMGRKTWDEVGKPLPNRRNIVISRAPLTLEGAEVVPTLDEAIARARTTDDEPRVIGGAQIYALAFPLATRIYATEIDRDYEGDVSLPPFDRSQFREVERRAGEDPSVVFVTLERS